MFKDSYLVNDEKIKFRRAKIEDNFEEIASLIYQTDKYIYPFWFGNEEECKKVMKEKLYEKGFFYNFENIYLAHDEDTNKIIGVLVALDKSVNLDYNYNALMSVNNNYEFTIKNYIKPLIEEINLFNDNTIYISNICVDSNYRSKKVGTKLLGYYIKQMEKAGYEEFALDCLLHNLRAKNLYHSLGFKEIQEIVGFDGTNNSKVEVVSMKRKKNTLMDFPFIPDEKI